LLHSAHRLLVRLPLVRLRALLVLLALPLAVADCLRY
jgi:hypothetical protein